MPGRPAPRRPKPPPPPLLREWRKYKGAQPAELADMLGLERESYYRLEREPWTISMKHLLKLAEIFEIEPRQFWSIPPRSGEEPRPSLDAIVEDMTNDQVRAYADMIERAIGKG